MLWKKMKRAFGLWLRSRYSISTMPDGDPSQVRSILLFGWQLIGDNICYIPVLDALRAKYPNAEMTLYAIESTPSVLLNQPCNVKVLHVGNPQHKLYHSTTWYKLYEWRVLLRSYRQVRALHFDLLIDLSGWFFKPLLLVLATRKKAITVVEALLPYTFSTYQAGVLYTLRQVEEPTSEWVLRKYAKTGLYDYRPAVRPVYYLSDDEKISNAQFRQAHNLLEKWVIGIHPGSSDKRKEWRYWGALACRIYASVSNVAFVCFEGPGEEAICTEVITQLEAVSAPCVRVKKPLKAYIARIGACDMMLCNDSGAGHIAAALDVPGFSVFGHILPDKWLPFGRRVMGLYKQADCFAECPYGRTRTCTQDIMLCKESISVDEAFENLMIFIQEVRQETHHPA